MPLYSFNKDMGKIRESMGKPFDGIPSGIKALDDKILGFGKGELCIIGGRPGLGKSSLARDILLYNSHPEIEAACDVGFLCTMEMPAYEICNYMAATLAKISFRKIQQRCATKREIERFNIKCGELIEYQIYIQDNSSTTPETIRNDLETISKDSSISYLIVDYLQLMSLHKPVESREREIAEIGRDLKAIAMEFNIPVIALSQLSRKAEFRESSRPRITDLRESGSLEQDTSKVILIHRPSYHLQQDDPN
ncbi:unnamed protein product, partial [marine sediment metagenome]